MPHKCFVLSSVHYSDAILKAHVAIYKSQSLFPLAINLFQVSCEVS